MPYYLWHLGVLPFLNFDYFWRRDAILCNIYLFSNGKETRVKLSTWATKINIHTVSKADRNPWYLDWWHSLYSKKENSSTYFKYSYNCPKSTWDCANICESKGRQPVQLNSKIIPNQKNQTLIMSTTHRIKNLLLLILVKLLCPALNTNQRQPSSPTNIALRTLTYWDTKYTHSMLFPSGSFTNAAL